MITTQSRMNTSTNNKLTTRMLVNLIDEHRAINIFFGSGTAELQETLSFLTIWDFKENSLHLDVHNMLKAVLHDLINSWHIENFNDID